MSLPILPFEDFACVISHTTTPQPLLRPLFLALALPFLATFPELQAQNLLNNPGFNSPIATNSAITTNWFVEYVYGGREDFAIADRTTWAKRTFGSADGAGVAWGGHFRAMTEGPMHACFRQTLSGLDPGVTYVVSGYMFRSWNRPDVIDIYIEAIGGRGSTRSANCTDVGSYGDRYYVTNTASANGTFEIRLQYNKNKGTVDKHAVSSGCFDDISLTRE